MCAQLRKMMENKANKVTNSGSMMDFKVLDKACKLIEKYALKELTIQSDGTITIIKEVHVPPKIKEPRKRKNKTPASQPFVNISNADLALVAANMMNKADRGHLNNHNRYRSNVILPNQGIE